MGDSEKEGARRAHEAFERYLDADPEKRLAWEETSPGYQEAMRAVYVQIRADVLTEVAERGREIVKEFKARTSKNH